MNSPDNEPDVSTLLIAARTGCELERAAALGLLLERFRAYLLTIAHGELPGGLRAKYGESDIVQDAFAEAQKAFERFVGRSEPELRSWLRSILLHKCSEVDRHFRGTRARDPEREQPLAGIGPASSEPTPSEFAVSQEESEMVRQAMNRLPEHYRLLLQWRHWDGLTFGEIGERLGRSEDAVRMVWNRAIARLRQELEGQR